MFLLPVFFLLYSTIKDGIYLLDVFQHLAVRTALKVHPSVSVCVYVCVCVCAFVFCCVRTCVYCQAVDFALRLPPTLSSSPLTSRSLYLFVLHVENSLELLRFSPALTHDILFSLLSVSNLRFCLSLHRRKRCLARLTPCTRCSYRT